MLKRKLITTLKQTINSLQEELENEKQKNSYLTKDLVVLLNNEMMNRKKMTDMENNIEFLVNNLTLKKRELARPDNQN